MFFINTEGIDPKIFSATRPPHMPESPEMVMADRDSTRAAMFYRWVAGVCLPLIQVGHPEAQLIDESRPIVCYRATDERDLHVDPTLRDNDGDRVFVTLGISADGKTCSTLLTQSQKLEGSFVQELDATTYEQFIHEPPAGYASVFRPHVDLHAAPREFSEENPRILYKARLILDGTNGLTVPKSELVIPVQKSR